MSEEGAHRIAPDEIMLLGGEGTAKAIVGRVAEVVEATDLVVDATDGWAGWTLAGPDARRGFSYLSQLELPEEGFEQGDVVHLPAKVLARAGEVHILVPSMLAADLRRRIVARCSHLGIVETGS
jgi:sarcosine oxidase gamma subunit